MPETAVQQEKACRRCGADIRPDSLFCYSCGSELPRSEAAAIERPSNGDRARRPGSEPPALRSAASIKRDNAKGKGRQFEVVWEPARENPGPLFIVATAAIVVFALVIVILATYLK